MSASVLFYVKEKFSFKQFEDFINNQEGGFVNSKERKGRIGEDASYLWFYSFNDIITEKDFGKETFEIILSSDLNSNSLMLKFTEQFSRIVKFDISFCSYRLIKVSELPDFSDGIILSTNVMVFLENQEAELLKEQTEKRQRTTPTSVFDFFLLNKMKKKDLINHNDINSYYLEKLSETTFYFTFKKPSNWEDLEPIFFNYLKELFNDSRVYLFALFENEISSDNISLLKIEKIIFK